MNNTLVFVGTTCFALLSFMLMSIAIGIDCTGNPNMSPLKAISMAQKGECRSPSSF